MTCETCLQITRVNKVMSSNSHDEFIKLSYNHKLLLEIIKGRHQYNIMCDFLLFSAALSEFVNHRNS